MYLEANWNESCYVNGFTLTTSETTISPNAAGLVLEFVLRYSTWAIYKFTNAIWKVVSPIGFDGQ